jgi:hypothetical protein
MWLCPLVQGHEWGVHNHMLLEGDGMPHNVREALAQHGLLNAKLPDADGSAEREISGGAMPERRLSAWSPNKAGKSALKLRSAQEQQKHIAAERWNYVETWNGVGLTSIIPVQQAAPFCSSGVVTGLEWPGLIELPSGAL